MGLASDSADDFTRLVGGRLHPSGRRTPSPAWSADARTRPDRSHQPHGGREAKMGGPRGRPSTPNHTMPVMQPIHESASPPPSPRHGFRPRHAMVATERPRLELFPRGVPPSPPVHTHTHTHASTHTHARTDGRTHGQHPMIQRIRPYHHAMLWPAPPWPQFVVHERRGPRIHIQTHTAHSAASLPGRGGEEPASGRAR
jgi:hypothetical protein